MPGTYRIGLSVIAVLIWTLITVWGIWTPHDPAPLTQGLGGRLAWPIIGAGLFMLVVAMVMGWRDIGLVAPRPWTSLRLLLLPGIYLLLFLGLALAIGLPPPVTILFLIANTLAVGFSEEIAFRGVLFHALRTRLSLWPAIWLTSVAFGAVHVINGFTTGDFLEAAIQAVTAFMSGVFFMAVMLRIRSIIPAMLFHAFWDFLLTLIAAGVASTPAGGNVHWWTLVVPVLFILPNFLYGLWLLRRLDARETGPAPLPAS